MAPPDELQRIRGIGPVLARRLCAAGLESFTKIAEAGEAGLGTIHGINQRSVASIVKQAAQLALSAQESSAQRQEQDDDLLDDLLAQVNAAARTARERFAQKLSGKKGRKLGEDVVRIAEALERLGSTQKRLKRAGKAVAKVRRVLSTLEAERLRKVRKGFGKSRKILTKLAKS